MAAKTKKSAKQIQDEILEARKPIVAEIVEMMRAGRLDWVNPVCGGAFGAPYNPVSGTRYRGGNRLILGFAMYALGYDDPRFMTYKQAKERGWQVRKGEKGVKLEVWKQYRCRAKDAEGGESREDAEKEEARSEARFVMRCVSTFTVFNASQIDGVPEIAKKRGHTDEDLAATCDEIEAASPCPVFISGSCSVAGYAPRADRIEMFSREAAVSLNDWARTLLHEEIHATGHESRLGRTLSTRFGSDDYCREELVAELGAAMLAEELCLPAYTMVDGKMSDHRKNHAAYLQGFASKLDEDPNILFVVAAEAEKACDLIARAWREDEAGEDTGSEAA